MIDLSVQVTQSVFGQMVGISQPAVSDLLSRGVLTDGADAGVWLTEYCGNLREVAAGRAGGGEIDLVEERALLARAQREKIEMQNAERRGELAPVSAMEMVLAAVGSKVGKILDTIPGLIRRRVPGVGSDVIAAITGDIAKCRNMAASMTLASLEADNEDDTAAKADDTETFAP